MATNNDNNIDAPPVGAADPNSAQFHLAFERLEAQIRAVPEEDLLTINVDIPSVVAGVVGSVPEILVYWSTIEQLPALDLPAVKQLQDRALALGHAHGLYRAAAGSAATVGVLAEEAQGLREILHADATALAKRKLMDEARVLKLRGGNAYKNIAFHLIGLVELFLESWPKIGSRTGVLPEELERARLVANRLVASVGLREQAPATLSAASLLRQQAYTLLAAAYEETRRAVQYIRYHKGDAETIAPSLYAGRGTRPAPDEPQEPPVTPTSPALTSPSAPGSGESNAGTGGAGSTGANTADANTAGAPNAPVPPGFPGSAPFLGRKS